MGVEVPIPFSYYDPDGDDDLTLSLVSSDMANYFKFYNNKLYIVNRDIIIGMRDEFINYVFQVRSVDIQRH